MDKFKKIILPIIIVALIIIIGILAYKLYQKNNEYVLASQNQNNSNFAELVDYVQNVQVYLAKAMISNSSKHGAETLTHLWREANLAQSYLSRLPIESQELENTEKFLNQVSDYSYSLSRKNINGEQLSDEDFKNLENLHNYSVELENTLNQLATDLNDGNIRWKDLQSNGDVEFAQQVSSSPNVFSNLEESFHEYSGLIYDGAFSEHLTSSEKKGLTGDNIDEEKAKSIANDFLGKDNVKEISSLGLSENANIPSYSFDVKTNQENSATITVSLKGGHVVYMNLNRDIQAESLSEDDACNKATEFLNSKGFSNMQKTYYLKNNGILTINFAYKQGDVVMYSDLIKVKVALDNGEILGIETTGYLNSHYERSLPKAKITMEQAKEKLNKDLNIMSEGLAMIPTEWETEVYCYEFKGKVKDTEFLVYINCETGEEEDILVITNTPNGTLTM